MQTPTHPTLLIAGIAGGSVSLRPLRRHLDKDGIAAETWERNSLIRFRHVRTYATLLIADILKRRDLPWKSLTIFGWSMGGLIAVDAMRNPEAAARVRRIITFGTPFYGTKIARIPSLFGLRKTYVADMAPGSEFLREIHRTLNGTSRAWDFSPIAGKHDMLIDPPGQDSHPTIVGPYAHTDPVVHEGLFALISELIRKPHP